MALFRTVATLGLAALFVGAAPAAGGNGEFFRPLRTASPPAIDGRLDDAVWREAPSVALTKTFIPDFGREASERTVAFMAYDAENLYFAFKCYDREPDKIKAALANRDTIRSDDFICINLDSFNDQQSLYAFYVNPLGIQTDSRYASGNEDFSVDFVWSSAGRLDADGYTVELAVPFKSIRYAGKTRVEMSIFFERRVSRRSEHCSYPALDPARGYVFLTQMMPLELEDIKQYTLLEVLPAYTFRDGAERVDGALVGAARRPRRPSDREATASRPSSFSTGPRIPISARSRPTPARSTSTSATTCSSPRRGPSSSRAARCSSWRGRRRPIPWRPSSTPGRSSIRGSASSSRARSGRRTRWPPSSPWTSRRRATRSTSPGPTDTPDSPSSATSERSASDGYLGAFYTGREYGGGSNEVAGADGQVRLTKASQVSFHGFGSWTQAAGGRRSRAADVGASPLGAEYLYDTRNLGVSISFYDISEDFQTDTGYLTRQGVAGLQASVLPRIYPKSRFFRKIMPNLSAAAVKDLPSGLFETNDALGVDGPPARQHDRHRSSARYSTEVFLGRRFDTSGGLVRCLSQVTKCSISGARTSGPMPSATSPTLTRATATASRAAVTYKPSEKFDLTASLTYSDFTRTSTGEKEYEYAIWRGRLTYQPNKYLLFRGVVEYNAFRREMLTDLLASFTYIPGTVIQLGYGSLYDRTEWVDGEYRDAGRFLEMKRGLFFKASYLWRL